MLSIEEQRYSTPVHHMTLNEHLKRHQSESMEQGSETSINEKFHSLTSLEERQDTNEDEPPEVVVSKTERTPDFPKKKKHNDGSNTNDSGLLRPTISSLLTTIQTLQSKISSKDQLIQCLADELITLAQDGCCWKDSLFACIASYPSKRWVDFDCALLVDYLTGFIYFKPEPSNQNRPAEGPVSDTENHPLFLKVVGATSFDSLLISWKIPQECVGQVSGFDIYVNDELVERIRDSEARRTLLHPIDLQQQILVTVCALDKCGVHLLCDNICIPPVSTVEGGLNNADEWLYKFQSSNSGNKQPPTIESSHVIDEQELHSEMYGKGVEQPIQDELSHKPDQQLKESSSSHTTNDQPPQKESSHAVEE